MSRDDHHSDGSHPHQDQQELVLLGYACDPWRASSQCVADLYERRAKLWTKDDLIDIERQLQESKSLDRFTVRCVDGRKIQIKNPMFGVEKPIWVSVVKYQNYWHLVAVQPEGPPEIYYCSYIVDWYNRLEIPEMIEFHDWATIFRTRRKLWESSESCQLFKSQLRQILATHDVSNIICFGLGDISSDQYDSAIQHTTGGKQPEDHPDIYHPMLQHAAALTIAAEVHSHTKVKPQLLIQDPKLTEISEAFLTSECGFRVVGRFGAAGLAEVDDDTLVFSAYTAAPVKQVIADVARPAAFITLGEEGTNINRFGKPFADAESPRTRRMWQDYKCWDFPVSTDDIDFMKGLKGLSIYSRIS